MKCYHHNDMDGRCAAAIVRMSIRTPDIASYIEIDYKDEIDINAIAKDETIYIVDFSFKPEIMEKVLKITSDIVWIDHHKTAFEYTYSKELKGLRYEEYSGCELTWKYFSPDESIPRFVKLIGDRDKWAWKFGDETALFNEGMKLRNCEPMSDIWKELFDVEMVRRIQEDGIICLKYRGNLCRDYTKSFGFELDFEGYKCFATGIYMFGSELFGERMDKYDICLAFEYSGSKWTIGLYSKNIDVSVIAKRFGGGGHTGAAGFVSDKLPFLETEGESV